MISKSHDHLKMISLRATLTDEQSKMHPFTPGRGVMRSAWLSEPSRGVVGLGTLHRVQNSGLDHDKAPGSREGLRGGSGVRGYALMIRAATNRKAICHD